MSCSFCEGDENLLSSRIHLSTKGDFYPGIDVYIAEKELCITAVANVYEPNFMEESIEICFCPMCGKKLGGD